MRVRLAHIVLIDTHEPAEGSSQRVTSMTCLTRAVWQNLRYDLKVFQRMVSHVVT